MERVNTSGGTAYAYTNFTRRLAVPAVSRAESGSYAKGKRSAPLSTCEKVRESTIQGIQRCLCLVYAVSVVCGCNVLTNGLKRSDTEGEIS